MSAAPSRNPHSGFFQKLRLLCFGMVCCLLVPSVPMNAGGEDPPPAIGTYSLCALDPETGDLGVAVQSKFFGVGSVVPWVQADTGAIATQSYANTQYGPAGLALLGEDLDAETVVNQLTAGDPGRELRQLGIVDARGRSAAYTGSECLDWAGHRTGDGYAVQGNILAGEAVVLEMESAFLKAKKSGEGELADWLMAALEAGEAAGGDKRGRQSAALVVARKGAGYAGLNSRYIDLRVEDHPEPVRELQRLLSLHKSFYKRAHQNPPSRNNPDSGTDKPPTRATPANP